jgi:2,4-dienoyl-CoA reductase (NADPH2)
LVEVLRDWRKGTKLGGLIPLSTIVKEIELNERLALVRYFKNQIAREGVTVRLGQEVASRIVDEFKPDALVVAAGAVHSISDIPGSNRRNVVSIAALHKQLQFYLKFLGPKTIGRLTRLWMPIGKRVVIVGGAIHGCQLAEFLTKRRRKVTIVHDEEVLGEGITVEDQLRLFPWLDKKGVARFTGVKYEEINDKGLVITTKEGKKQTIEADTIVLALPFLPNTDIAKSLKGKASETYIIGSCTEPGLIVDAIADGARIGHSL